MNRNKLINTKWRALPAIGLVLVSGSVILNDFVKIPDFFRGLMVGIGLGLMVIYLIVQKKVERPSN